MATRAGIVTQRCGKFPGIPFVTSPGVVQDVLAACRPRSFEECGLPSYLSSAPAPSTSPMRKLLTLVLAAAVVGQVWAQTKPGDLVFIEGGTFKNTKSNYYGKPEIPNFFLGRMVAVAGFYIPEGTR